MINEVRGEVELNVNGKSYVLCAELARVAAWTRETGITSLVELHRRLALADPAVLYAGARNLHTGDGDLLVKGLHFRDFPALQKALTKALIAGLDEGNAGAAEDEETSSSSTSLGGDGSVSRLSH